jgi:uncharacterized protein with PQ loop repeat
MEFKILDPNVSLSMNVFLVIANIINVVYNIPQVYTTFKRKSTRDFSSWFLFLRVVGNLIWVAYAIEVQSLLMLINNVVTVAASVFVSYYKILEIIADRRQSQQGHITVPMKDIESDSEPESDSESVRTLIITP